MLGAAEAVFGMILSCKKLILWLNDVRWGYKLHGRAHKYVLMLSVKYERGCSLRNLRKMAKMLFLSAWGG